MQKLINYIRSCFCKHEWELIDHIESESYSYSCKTYRCKKCGYARQYKSY